MSQIATCAAIYRTREARMTALPFFFFFSQRAHSQPIQTLRIGADGAGLQPATPGDQSLWCGE